MACTVFGTPVTNDTLKGIPEYADLDDNKITRKELGEVAIALKNAEGKDINARAYVENMYKRYESKEDVHCVLGLIYNATGAALKFKTFWNWYCFVAPAPFPAFIENGQWGAFLCVSDKGGDFGCAGAVAYSGSYLKKTTHFDHSAVDQFRAQEAYPMAMYNHSAPKVSKIVEKEAELDHVIGWDTRFLPNMAQVYVDIVDPAQFNATGEFMKEKVSRSGQHKMVEKEGLLSSATMGSDKMSVLEVIIRHEFNS